MKKIMGRDNKLLAIPITSVIPGIEKFLKMEIYTEEMKEFIEMYKDVLSSIQPGINDLMQLEEVITQIRCLKHISSEIKIFVLQKYVYARSTFYRSDKQTKDIRVSLGLVEDLGTDMDVLRQDEKFMEYARDTIWQAMNEEIDKSIKVNV